jgi:uncharacterized RDD family membrane protein YckC
MADAPDGYRSPAEQWQSSGFDSTTPVEPADFGIRFVARAIDSAIGVVLGLIGGLISGMLLGVLTASGLVDRGWQQRIGQFSVIGLLVAMVGVVLNHAIAETMGGATAGKAICGLRVRREDLSLCSFGGALIRGLGFFVDALFCGVVGYSVMSGSPMKQRLGDKWGETVVVKASSLERAKGPLPDVGVGLSLGLAVSLAALMASIFIRAL